MGNQGTTGALGFGLGGLSVTTGLALGAALVAHQLDSYVAAGAAAHLLASLPVWLAIALHGHHLRRASSERIEAARLAALAAEGRAELFTSAPGEGDAAKGLERFERLGVIAAAILVGVLELVLAYGLWRLRDAQRDPLGSLAGAAFLTGAAFALLLLGRYGFALEGRETVSAGAGGRRATSGALATFVAGLALAIQFQLGIEWLDSLGLVFLVIESVLGLEAFLLVLLEGYRPRRAGVVSRPPYDSRLLGLLAAPADIARSIARAVDYQFGFGLSQTWFYRFLERRIVPLIAFSLLSFWSLSCLTVVQPSEAGLLRRLGRLQGEALPPGLHVHLPWPIDHITHLPAARLHAIKTGHVEDDHEERSGDREETLLWTSAHVDEQEDLVLLARAERGQSEEVPVNLLAVSATIHYRIADPMAYVRRVQDPDAMLEVLAERAVARMLSSADLEELLRDRGTRADELRQRLQTAAITHELGLTILDAPLNELHPPVEVGSAFESITSAQEHAAAEIYRARAEAATIGPESEQEARRIRQEAHSTAAARIAKARAGATRFGVLRQLAKIAPRVFRIVRLLDTLVAGAGDARKIILGRKSAMTELNLEDRIQAGDMQWQGLLPGDADSDDEQPEDR